MTVNVLRRMGMGRVYFRNLNDSTYASWPSPVTDKADVVYNDSACTLQNGHKTYPV
jgi:hypothetical protein